MQLIKPMKLGVTTKIFPNYPNHYLVIGAMGFFNLFDSENLLVDALQMEKVYAAMEPNAIFDSGMPKVQGEAMVAGKAFSLEGKEVGEMDVGLEIGPIDKRLKVFGNRFWEKNGLFGNTISEPEPFVEMPISFTNAFGGNGFDKNPIGKGFGKMINSKGEAVRPLPNIENFNCLITHNAQKPDPVSLGQINSAWPQRSSKVGTFDQEWVEQAYSGFPKDIDPTYFNEAPSDQQCNGFFKGGESFRLRGLHPSKFFINGNLPRIIPRCFIYQDLEGTKKFIEVEMNLETVWFFPNDELGVVIFRGKVLVQDMEGLDVDTLLMAYEGQDDSPRAKEYYREVLRLRTDKETKMAHAINESQLSPIKSSETLERDKEEKRRAEIDQMRARREVIEFHVENFFSNGVIEKPKEFEIPELEPDPIGAIPPEALERMDFDFSEIFQNAEKLVEKVLQESEEKLAEAKKKEEDALVEAERKGSKPSKKLEEQKRKSKKRALKIPSKFRLLNKKDGKLEKTEFGSFLEDIGISLEDIENKDLLNETTGRQIDELKEGEMQARRLSPDSIYPTETLLSETSLFLRELFVDCVKRGDILAGRDFAGADLSGLNLRGFDLREILLEKADLTNVQFQNSNLSGAVLTEAKLDNASFAGANLEKANLSKTVGNNVDLREANLKESMLMEAKLEEANFSKATMEENIAIKGRFRSSSFEEATIKEGIFVEADFENTNFNKSVLIKTKFIKAKLKNAKFREATIDGTVFMDTDGENCNFSKSKLIKKFASGKTNFKNGNFSEVDACQCSWMKMDLTGANFFKSRLDECVLIESTLKNTNMRFVSLKKAQMIRGNFQNAQLEGANLFQAVAHRADFTGANLMGANLFQAFQHGAKF